MNIYEILKLLNENETYKSVTKQEAISILCHVLNCDKVFIYTCSDYELAKEKEEKFFELLNDRALGKPLQYLKGYQEFMSLKFEVGPDVLIPRQDTEILVEYIIDYIKRSNKKGVKVLDIGTGSGCINISILYYLEDVFATAIDISNKALDIAKRNAHNLGVSDRVSFINSDLFEQLDRNKQTFDIIVSNPPYILSDDIENLQIEVKKHEPLTALDGGADGLKYYKEIIRQAHNFLVKDGILAFEVGINQAQAVSELMNYKYKNVCVYKDLSNIDRVVVGQLKQGKEE